MRLLKSFLLLMALPLVTHAEDGWRARGAENFQNANTYQGRLTNLGLGYRTTEKTVFGLSADLLTREYSGGATVHDQQFGALISQPLSERTYIDVAGNAGTTTDIYAKWGATVAPHYVWNGTDFGLGFRYAEYRLSKVGGYNPTVFHYFKNGLSLGAGAYFIRTEEYITSGSLTALYNFNDHHAVRATGGAGRALEDAGLTAHFNTMNAEYTYTFAGGFWIGCGWTDYWSQVRRERTLGLRLGWR